METARSVACDRHESKRRSFAISGRTKSQRIVPRPEPGERGEGRGRSFKVGLRMAEEIASISSPFLSCRTLN